MLHLYFGNDSSSVRREAFAKAKSLLLPDGEVSVMTPENSSRESLMDAVGTVSLFRPHEVFVLDTLSEDEGLFDALLALVPLLSESPNQFVVVEGPLLAGPKKVFASAADTIEERTLPKKEYNAFALAEALGARDKKQLWILLNEAWREGRKNEEIVGTLFWQLKTLRLAEVSGSALASGQKPFVFDKAKRALRNFKEGEVTRLAEELLVLYHDGHTGRCDLTHALEAWVLKL